MKRTKKQADTASVDMTPLLDIVFIMLIFFIVSAVFFDEDAIALAQTPQTEAPSSPEMASIQIYLSGEGAHTVDGQSAAINAIPLRIETALALTPNAVVPLRSAHDVAVKDVVFLKDRLDVKGLPYTIKVDPPVG